MMYSYLDEKGVQLHTPSRKLCAKKQGLETMHIRNTNVKPFMFPFYAKRKELVAKIASKF
jgi:hypothetical protein